jgi:hypothetical protein
MKIEFEKIKWASHLTDLAEDRDEWPATVGEKMKLGFQKRGEFLD